jgi:hypothetical protein
MPRRKFARVDYDLISLDLPNELLGAAVQLKYHVADWYFMASGAHDEEGTTEAELERIPINSRALSAITQRRKRDSQKNQLELLAKRLGFSVSIDGDSAWIIWPKWWESEGLKPRIRNQSPPDNRPMWGDHELEHEQEQEPDLEQEQEHETFAPDGATRVFSQSLVESMEEDRLDKAGVPEAVKEEVLAVLEVATEDECELRDRDLRLAARLAGNGYGDANAIYSKILDRLCE